MMQCYSLKRPSCVTGWTVFTYTLVLVCLNVVPLYFPAVRHVSPGPTCSPVPVSVIKSHIRMRALCDHSLHSHTVLSCLNIYDLASGLGPVLLSLLSLAKKPMCSTLNTDRFILATVMSPDVREQTSVSTSSRITGETFSFFFCCYIKYDQVWLKIIHAANIYWLHPVFFLSTAIFSIDSSLDDIMGSRSDMKKANLSDHSMTISQSFGESKGNGLLEECERKLIKMLIYFYFLPLPW